MYKTAFRVSLFVIILMLPYTLTHAAGLGKLIVNSALGQPLSAEIDVVANNREEIPSLKATIATREAFTQAGINYEPHFSTIKVSIELRSNGDPYVKLTSPQAINDPFLNLLVELNWASGRILREYALLLDPAEGGAQDIAAPSVNPVAPVAVASSDTDENSSRSLNRQDRNSTRQTNRSNQSNETYGPVIRGDTLSSIARQVLPAGVDLNQMLVALYRANRDAFIANNMNLLRVGAVLKIPEKNEVTAIDTTTARNEIRVQVRDWHNYQSKMAAIRSESPSAGISQSDQGKITARLEKKSVAADEPAREVLRLSSAQLSDKSGNESESALLDRLRSMEEDAIARNLALKEANERVAMLEKSIENLKRLLELKDSVLAQAQVKAEGNEVTPQILPIDAINSDSEIEAGQEISSHEQQAAETQIPAQPAPAVTPVLSQETEEKSLIDSVFDYIEYIGAVLIVGLLVILLIIKRRRSQAAEEEALDERSADFSSEMQSRLATVAAAAHSTSEDDNNYAFPEHGKNEAAYGNISSYSETKDYDDEFDKDAAAYEEAEEQADRFTSTRAHVSDSMQVHEAPVEHSQESNPAIILGFSETNDQSVESNDADTAEIAKNEIDFDLTDTTPEIDQDVAGDETLAAELNDEEKIELSDNQVDLHKSNTHSDFEIKMDLDDSRDSSGDTPILRNEMAQEDNALDYESTHSGIDLTDDESANEVDLPVIDFDSKSVDNDSNVAKFEEHTPIDFEREQEFSESTKKSLVPELGLADIDLNIEDSDLAHKNDDISELEEKSEQWQEVETKLDLAKAYQEMDDKEGAKEMLEEVIRDGDAKQKRVARKLLKNL